MSECMKYELPENPARLLGRLLDTIEQDIAPLTERAVSKGCKVFGSAILRKSDLSLVIAETNNEVENPLWHGEIHCLKKFYELEDRPATGDLIFLATHEPCSLCLSAITWAGFDNFFYFFSHQDSRDSFAIPHDLKILEEVFGLADGQYNRRNAYWSSWGIRNEIARLDPDDRESLWIQASRLDDAYDQFSDSYQKSKSGSAIPLS